MTGYSTLNENGSLQKDIAEFATLNDGRKIKGALAGLLTKHGNAPETLAQIAASFSIHSSRTLPSTASFQGAALDVAQQLEAHPAFAEAGARAAQFALFHNRDVGALSADGSAVFEDGPQIQRAILATYRSHLNYLDTCKAIDSIAAVAQYLSLDAPDDRVFRDGLKEHFTKTGARGLREESPEARAQVAAIAGDTRSPLHDIARSISAAVSQPTPLVPQTTSPAVAAASAQKAAESAPVVAQSAGSAPSRWKTLLTRKF